MYTLAKLWAINAFNVWKVLCGLDTTRSIAYLLKDEYFVKDLVDMISSFILQVAKKDGSLYPPIK
jgi:hypothetical protein